MDANNLPEWQSHKKVRAARIAEVGTMTIGEDVTVTLHLEGTTETWSAHNQHAIFARHKPQPGDYLVVYADGYVSLSPAKAFEEGYTRVATNG